MGPAEVRQFCELDDAGKQLMRAAMMTCQHACCQSSRVVRDDTSEADEHVSPAVKTAQGFHHAIPQIHPRH